jgi:hypothetical protein
MEPLAEDAGLGAALATAEAQHTGRQQQAGAGKRPAGVRAGARLGGPAPVDGERGGAGLPGPSCAGLGLPAVASPRGRPMRSGAALGREVGRSRNRGSPERVGRMRHRARRSPRPRCRSWRRDSSTPDRSVGRRARCSMRLRRRRHGCGRRWERGRRGRQGGRRRARPWRCGLRRQEGQRVVIGVAAACVADSEVQVGRRRRAGAGGAHVSEPVAGGHLCARSHGQRREVEV